VVEWGENKGEREIQKHIAYKQSRNFWLCVQIKIITQQPKCSEKGDEQAMGEGDCE
jgi:hypothetical protein